MNEDKITLTTNQYVAYWWVKRMKEFVDDVISVGYSTEEGVQFTQMFDCLQPEHWRAFYLRLSPLIAEEYQKNGRFVQSTNRAYGGHDKINEMLKSIIHLEIPNVTLNPTGKTSLKLMIFDNDEGEAEVFLTGDDGGLSNERTIKVDLTVDKDYILTGDKSYLETENSL